MDPVSAILALVPAKYGVYVLASGAVCAIITAFVPMPKSGPGRTLWTFLNVASLNILHAKNAASVEATTIKEPPHA